MDIVVCYLAPVIHVFVCDFLRSFLVLRYGIRSHGKSELRVCCFYFTCTFVFFTSSMSNIIILINH